MTTTNTTASAKKKSTKKAPPKKAPAPPSAAKPEPPAAPVETAPPAPEDTPKKDWKNGAAAVYFPRHVVEALTDEAGDGETVSEVARRIICLALSIPLQGERRTRTGIFAKLPEEFSILDIMALGKSSRSSAQSRVGEWNRAGNITPVGAILDEDGKALVVFRKVTAAA